MDNNRKINSSWRLRLESLFTFIKNNNLPKHGERCLSLRNPALRGCRASPPNITCGSRKEFLLGCAAICAMKEKYRCLWTGSDLVAQAREFLHECRDGGASQWCWVYVLSAELVRCTGLTKAVIISQATIRSSSLIMSSDARMRIFFCSPAELINVRSSHTSRSLPSTGGDPTVRGATRGTSGGAHLPAGLFLIFSIFLSNIYLTTA